MSDVVDTLIADHAGLSDGRQVRRYFAKFDVITGHLVRVIALMEREKRLIRAEARIVAGYVARLDATFQALSLKYLMTGRETGQFLGSLAIDRSESGFPIFRELLTMANDAAQADKHLAGMPSIAGFKEQMIAQIVGDLSIPTRLQFALSQRLYYEALLTGDLFWAANDPEPLWRGEEYGRRRYLLHWAVYDSQVNLPTIYLMDVEDTGRTGLPKDQQRWPEAQRHLMAQAVAGLKLVTIAKGFDEDFDDLHPKRLRRIHLGPMYSSTFTAQTGPLGQVLQQASNGPGQDWALAWTVEDLESDRVTEERSGWFGKVERQIFALDPFSGRGAETGATRTERAIILPERPFQVLAETNPPGFGTVEKFIVSPGGHVMRAR